MQLNIVKIALVIATGMTHTAFADYCCCKHQNCTECGCPVDDCLKSCTNVSVILVTPSR